MNFSNWTCFGSRCGVNGLGILLRRNQAAPASCAYCGPSCTPMFRLEWFVNYLIMLNLDEKLDKGALLLGMLDAAVILTRISM